VKALVAESADQRLGHRAAAALGAVHNPDAAAQLAAIATGNDSALVRANAVQALAASGSHAQAPALIKLLSDRSQPLRVRLEAALTLGRLRDDTAVPAMARLLGNQEPEDGSLRLATEQALAQIGTPAARKALAQVRAASPGEQRLLSALNVR
jgi:HEAT repeat protein